MLAASISRSNVPPNDLQAAPILTLAAVASKQLSERAAIGRLETQPSDSLQKHAAILQLRRYPNGIAIEQLCGPVGSQSDRTTNGISFVKLTHFSDRYRAPDQNSAQAVNGIQGQIDNQQESDSGE